MLCVRLGGLLSGEFGRREGGGGSERRGEAGGTQEEAGARHQGTRQRDVASLLNRSELTFFLERERHVTCVARKQGHAPPQGWSHALRTRPTVGLEGGGCPEFRVRQVRLLQRPGLRARYSALLPWTLLVAEAQGMYLRRVLTDVLTTWNGIFGRRVTPRSRFRCLAFSLCARDGAALWP